MLCNRISILANSEVYKRYVSPLTRILFPAFEQWDVDVFVSGRGTIDSGLGEKIRFQVSEKHISGPAG
jgi:hypothetical protein